VKKLLIITFLFSFIFAGCGRKQKNIFYFPEKGQEELKINKLELPCVHEVNVLKKNNGNEVSWSPVKDCSIQSGDQKIIPTLLGYNVYRLVNRIFVPKKPVNESLIKSTSFLDTQVLKEESYKSKKGTCYLVNVVFEIRNKMYHGPVSQIVCTK